MEKEKTVFKTLSKVDVSKFVEKKSNLSYLSWVYAWANVVEIYPNANYEILKNEAGLPYFESDSGVMVYTKVTIEDITRTMWLPVMDGANKAMKSKPYSYKTRYGDKSVDAFTMFDVNKTLMRCLVKNLAMFGLGINVYAGEDLPLDLEEDPTPTKTETTTKTTPKKTTSKPKSKTVTDTKKLESLKALAELCGVDEVRMKEKYGNFIFKSPFENIYDKALKELTTYKNTKK